MGNARAATVEEAIQRGDSEMIPGHVCDIEFSQPMQSVPLLDERGRRFGELWALVRIFDEPVGILRLPLSADVDYLPAATLADEIDLAFGDIVSTRVKDADADVDAVRHGLGCTPRSGPTFLVAHERFAALGPDVTVVVCTRNRAADLSRALDSLRGQSYRRFRVLVIDNAPSDDATYNVVAARPRDESVEYLLEPQPGLSRARNRALRAVDSPVLAFLDDDEVADRHWLMELVGALVDCPQAAAVSGTVVPAELETWPQMWFEEFGGHSKGRGFVPDRFSAHDSGGQHPLYPLPPFGVGANMAFRREQLLAVGGFDTALGAGTPTNGGEDTLVFSQLLMRGDTILYQPTSVTRHYHRRDYASLERQMFGYGVGLTAYYTSLLCSDRRLIVPMARLAPRAIRDVLGGGTARAVPASFPGELLREKNRGMLRGPALYLRTRRSAKRMGLS